MPEVRWWAFFQHKKMSEYLFHFFYISAEKSETEKWTDRRVRERLQFPMAYRSLTYKRLHFVPCNGPAPVLLALFLWSVIPYMDCSAFKTTAPGSTQPLELCARVFPASKRTCVHWGLLHKKRQSSSPALLHTAYLCRSTFSPKLRILWRIIGLLCSTKNLKQ